MRAVTFQQFMEGDEMATQISNLYQGWKDGRSPWEAEVQETRNYIFATSTRTTENAKLPWRNSTTIPKLTQIRDNLHANYIAALFPNEDWLSWVAADEASDEQDKRQKIEAYMKNRLRESGFEEVMDQLLLDYIDYGNAFAGVTFVNETISDVNGNKSGYVGPKCYRISPYDIVFDPTADDFRQAPKVIRVIKTMGQLAVELKHNPDLGYNQDIIDLIGKKRIAFTASTAAERKKINGFTMDGFNSLDHYFGSGLVEVLEFYGDLYDMKTGELLEDYIITIVDRTHIIRKVPRNSMTNVGSMFHVGWRRRPDNLYAQGPLDKLVGMQYRIDHLENLKADALDQIVFPRIKIKGEVQDFSDTPGSRIYIGEEGDVGYLTPPTEALVADNQIALLESKMEEFAGAPKEAMGIRTPGEKTAYEVQQLQNAASRIFQAKIDQFERLFLEPLINAMLEQAREHLIDTLTVGQANAEDGMMDFIQISKEDIKGSGKLYPRGARHYAAIAKSVQELNAFFSSPVGQDPDVKVHFSGKELAKVISELLKFDRYQIYSPNIRVSEQLETQKLAAVAQQQLAEHQSFSGEDVAAMSAMGPPPQQPAPAKGPLG